MHERKKEACFPCVLFGFLSFFFFFFKKTVYQRPHFKKNTENSHVLFVTTMEPFEAMDPECESGRLFALSWAPCLVSWVLKTLNLFHP